MLCIVFLLFAVMLFGVGFQRKVEGLITVGCFFLGMFAGEIIKAVLYASN